ncbi:threonine ammonia-lyase [Microbispora triticiradicis]|uniref:Pyridoxal-phosphate dependent enzyme n=2 Tax=Microbispora TaxID=2005 RepID=A0ABY3LUR3_9ACTN|nr:MULTISPECIES: pyridoxal-phosphate dependent enzyme [Microbispora]TLP61967.1 pyridoxal-phosphate dependent enzyme [Microbispora fusca]TYB56059.1 pyridoxal-phosphate dependent enzyme [Microbispora tritici]
MTGIRDILDARRLIAHQLPETPMWSYPVLNAAVGVEVYVKHENVQPTGAFKVRGGITLLARMADRGRGVVTYSTGNHAQSIAYASRLYGVPCAVLMPDNPNPAKVAAVEALGATVEVRGATMVETAGHARDLAERTGRRLIGPADEPDIIAGVGTLYAEMFAARPDLDAVFVPVGSGTGAAAACLAAAALAPGCRVIAVQSAQAPAAHDSWRLNALVNRPVKTVVEGLATGSAFATPQAVMRDRLDDFVLVGDDEILRAQRMLLGEAHTLAEGAGAAALAGLLARREEFAGRRVAVVCTGGNAGPKELARLLAAL